MRYRNIHSRFLPLLIVGLIGGCSDGSDGSLTTHASNPYTGYTSEIYDGTTNWLCHPEMPGEENVCNRNIDATLVFADGSTQFEATVQPDNPPIDCFYLYPTSSQDQSPNSDFIPAENEEIVAVVDIAARYRSVCNVYAPVYRQRTIPSLLGLFDTVDFNTAYGDALDAFKQYIANARGRGFILIGHSQGSRHLVRLIQEEIETSPWLASHMISAHIPGHLIELPNDASVGATFQSTPPCTPENDTGCFVNYSSFRASDPPLEENANYAITDSEETRAACTNPNQLGNGRLELDGYFSTSALSAYNDEEQHQAIDTPFFKLPGLVTGECIEHDGKGYLAISYDADPDDPRTDDVGGDLFPGWGLHLIDVSLAQGDLLRLAESQSESWLRHKSDTN